MTSDQKRMEREEAERRDVEIINAHADALNAEAEDVLEDQVSLWECGSASGEPKQD